MTDFFNMVEKKILFPRRSEMLESQDKSQSFFVFFPKEQCGLLPISFISSPFSLFCIMQSVNVFLFMVSRFFS